ncbi:hypothetical protein E2C01_088409 [Portunus trituberculatus]|uniref:Uncharacterized protein n=1 Tax=Portunus trituberculatus TaxID=210409 RepID=A0A5B7JFB5_PORTR|nr:hypothetical protein [Portunus trituberculatus]
MDAPGAGKATKKYTAQETIQGDLGGRRGTVEPCVLWDPRGLQAHGFESCPRSECRLGLITRGNGFLAGGV